MPTKFRILLIDDDPFLMGIIEKASIDSFSEAIYISVPSVEEAKAYFNNLVGYGPKLIFLDLKVNDSSSGLDFLAFLRAHPQAHLLPVVVLTADELPNCAKKSYKLGANSFTIKPVDFKGWQTYLAAIRDYWFKTVTVPQLIMG